MKKHDYEVELDVLRRLQDEVYRISADKRFKKSKIAREALQEVLNWSIEESVEPAHFDG